MTKVRYAVGLLATSLAVAGCSSSTPSSLTHQSTPAVSPQSQSQTTDASAAQTAPVTGQPGSGSNNEAVGRLNCQTLNVLGINAQSVSSIVNSTMQVNPGMSKEAAQADLVSSVHLYCPQFDDELHKVAGN